MFHSYRLHYDLSTQKLPCEIPMAYVRVYLEEKSQQHQLLIADTVLTDYADGNGDIYKSNSHTKMLIGFA